MKNQIHTFLIQGEILSQDLKVLKESVLKYLESDPIFVVIDLSQTQISVSETELQKQLTEIRAFAQAKNLSMVIAQTDVESMHAHHRVVEMALQKKIQILENKVELRKKMTEDAAHLQEENNLLKRSIQDRDNAAPFQHKLSPIAEKLWDEK